MNRFPLSELMNSNALNVSKKVQSIQRSGTEAIRTQIQPSKPKMEITKITNSKNTNEHMVNRVSSYFQKGDDSASQTELKAIRL